MRGVKAIWALAFAALLTLGAAAVWMGGLNQDEGWYLYAANLVSEGRMPYRDFFYTQGPLLPIVYSAFTGIWRTWGLAGARLFTLLAGVAGILFAVALARRLVSAERRNGVGLIAFALLGCNLYHLYYLTIPKTYALAALFVMSGFYLLSIAVERRAALALPAGLALAFAAGARISLGALLVVTGLGLLLSRRWRPLAWFCIGGFAGLALVYGPFLLDDGARAGLLAAQRYHAARGGSDLVWVVGSFSRLVRWYLPAFSLVGFGILARFFGTKPAADGSDRSGAAFAPGILLWGFLAVFAVQMMAPFPYEDYQVPVMGLLAVFAAVTVGSRLAAHGPLAVLCVCLACSFGSPLLEKWMTNGQDRFWSLKKEKCELAQLRDVARRIEALDPGGRDLLTQDLYLAIETDRHVPQGLEMGPFAMLDDAGWRKLLESAPCRIAALSGYSFAIDPPACGERSLDSQMAYWGILKRKYELVGSEAAFGQNATTLMILRRK